MEITFKNIKETYHQKIQALIDRETVLTASTVVELSVNLFKELKVKGIFDSRNKDSDMLLFQFGIYNWGDEFGEHFSFDITRQFISPQEDEPYQLNLTLIYDPEMFKEVGAYNCWSSDYSNIENFVAHIRTTDGYKAAEKSTPKTYQLEFGPC